MLAELIAWATQEACYPGQSDLVMVSLAALQRQSVSEIKNSRRSFLHIRSHPENFIDGGEPTGHFLRATEAQAQHPLLISLTPKPGQICFVVSETEQRLGER